ncbi:M20/M25/M40 family metallo-hydrolase [Nocardioides bizhenqiangii]|uniref:M20/M25/M40 family metallo-hydrolase n=1 Tax=Nocardioides bizhenqiangii TaxID=3095076 RepID=A0ABZ0ZTE4_9ACTN|nr:MULTISPECIES: M20/M25/M40 family metallo-hydrolase [unclassified Nocardioides]MDZ5622814.1 M20/M25/M40 family metallo-hydrolase [Nocardioides sp. HM23]WQQ27074.1 M20/M25/M40 family metallo-hydrolase [Nocardioides sp. HM61]
MTSATPELLQALIRNQCVNDGTPESGGESRNADVLAAVLEGPGVELERYESLPGRASLVARIDGSDPAAPSLLLMGHTDVVPANAENWRHDPFGGEQIDGEIWGRGAVDMLNHTSSMAIAMRRLADSGFRPRGTLVYLAVADEEGGGTYGAEWLLEHQRESVAADYVITETGGMSLPVPGATETLLPVMVGEKGFGWVTLVVRGTPGHGSMPLRTDNALVKAAEVVQRVAAIQSTPRVEGQWRDFVEACRLPEDVERLFLDADALTAYCTSEDADLQLARLIHAATTTTIAPTMVRGGVKTNVIADRVEIELDIRTLPGVTADDLVSAIAAAVGEELMASVDVQVGKFQEASLSSPESPLWDSLAKASSALLPGSRPVPFLLVGVTDARFFRGAGSTAYGYGLFSDRISFRDFASMFHGNDERIDIESLRLSTELWSAVAQDFLD